MSEINFKNNEWKYWDSVLPPKSDSDGKYAHLHVSRNGKIIGVRPGFRLDGTKLPTGVTESEERVSVIVWNSPEKLHADSNDDLEGSMRY